MVKIAVLGAGAMGCVYGGHLSRTQDVWLHDVWEQQVNKINVAGISVSAPGETTVDRPRATTIINDIGKVDLIIICLKAGYTMEAAVIAEVIMKPETMVLTLQNGLGNAELLARMLGPERILVGSTVMGAVVLEPGHVVHAGLNETHIAAWNKAGESHLDKFSKMFSRSGMPTVVESNAVSLLWSKVAVHAGINAVTAITGATNKQLLRMPEALQLAERATAEVVAVTKVASIPLLSKDCIADMHAYAESMREYRSPMLQDIRNKRKSEVDAINGAVASEGKRLGVPTPVNEILHMAIKTVENLPSK